MNVDPTTLTVENNVARHRFEIHVGDDTALLNYRRSGDDLIITHTEVPQPLEGHGIAAKLARTALDYARSEQLTVVPFCPYVASYMRKHTEYQDLIKPEFRQRVLEDWK